jgi:hypothetical protein
MNNKQLLQKYVDSGARLTEYQVRSLPDNLKNTYIRKLLISIDFPDVSIGNVLEDYEFELLTPEEREEYTESILGWGFLIRDDQFNVFTPEEKERYLAILVKEVLEITEYQFELLTSEQQKIFRDNGGKIY